MKDQTILQKWLARQKEQAVPTSAPKRPEAAWAPLSYGQQQMWLLQKLNPGNPFYNYAEIYRLEGILIEEHLKEAYRKLVARHEILRTVFVESAGIAQQRILSEVETEVAVVDYTGSLSSKEENLQQFYLSEARRPFDLESGPLTSLYIIKLSPTSYRLLFCLHHIITDKWSMQVLRRELAFYYRQLLEESQEELPNLPFQYGDYSYKQRNSSNQDREVNYWKNQLADAPAYLPLATDRPPPKRPSYQGQFQSQKFSVTLSGKLRDLAASTESTLFHILLAAYKIVLWQRSGQNDILVGTPVTNRKTPELEQLIGYFNDTLVLRDQIDPNATFMDFLSKVKVTTLEAFDHKDIPFEEIVRELQPQRESGRNPLFQHMLIYHRVPENPDFGPDLSLDYQSFDAGVTKFDLTLYVSDVGDHLYSLIEYAKDLFDPSTIDRIQNQLINVLEEATERPQRKLQQFSRITKEELDSLIQFERGQTIEGSVPSVVHHLLRIVERHPNRIAVSFADKQLSYAELNQRSENLAQRLLQYGLGPGQLVGLHASRSLELVVGIWGILKAGGAYVPLAPEYPADRLQYMLEDAKVKLIVSDREKPPTFAGDVKIISVDGPAPTQTQRLPDIDLSQGAYLIYTSGSSGPPKGVLISHKNLAYSTAARQAYYSTAPHTFLLLSPFSFDSSIAGLFWTACTGSELVISPQRIEQDLDQLAKIINERQVSHTLLLPSLYETILAFVPTDQIGSLGSVIVAGEACSPDLIQTHFNKLPNCSLYNEYGPTEATVWSSVAQLQIANTDVVPIGRPAPGVELIILDKKGRRCPIGIPGELYIGGPGLANEYWQRPKLSAEKFIPHPFIKDSKLYRTGDLVKWDNEGQLLFLGRRDEQIKIRGHRVELGEIQAMIRTSAGVQDAVVLQNEQKQLVAFLTGEFDEKELRVLLQKQLPNYMVPTFLVGVAVFPLLPNGKLDRSTLIAQTVAENANATPIELAELTLTESKLHAIWQEVLGVQSFGIDDNFFEIGGDSILSIKILARAREKGIHLTPTAIFEHQTIARLALFAETTEVSQQDKKEDKFTVGDLLPIQQWFFSEHQLAPHFWNQASYLHHQEKGAFNYWETLIPAVVKKHPILQARFRKLTEGWQLMLPAKNHNSGFFRKIDLSTAHASQVEELVEKRLIELQAKRQLATDPLFEGIYFFMPPEIPDRIVLLAHHLVIDAVSWSILWGDLQLGMSQLEAGKRLDLGPVEHTFFNWATQLNNWGNSNKFDQELAFWQAQTDVSLEDGFQPNLPYAEKNTSTTILQLGAERSSALNGLAHEAYNTNTEEILICALLRALQQIWKQQQICLNIEHHGRETDLNNTDFSQAVGWFTAAFPLRFDLLNTNTIGEQILTIKEQLRSAPQRGLSYGILRYLANAPGLNQMPTIHFNYLGKVHLEDEQSPRLLLKGLREPNGERYRRWEINCKQHHNGLDIHWTFDKKTESSDQLKAVQAVYLNTLEEIIDHCLKTSERQYSPSDFPDSGLNQDDLDQLLGQIDL
ncbi:MAG: amino acid adenylation domain-containing protein [Bacteroidota bacterium]